MKTTPPPTTSMVVICRIGTSHYALPIRTVLQASRLMELQPLADAPVAVCGLVEARGSTVPVIDGRALMGEPPSYDLESHIVLVGADVSDAPEVGLLVDEILGVHRVGGEGIAPLDHVDGVLCGVVRDLPRPAALIDVDELFALAHGSARD